MFRRILALFNAPRLFFNTRNHSLPCHHISAFNRPGPARIQPSQSRALYSATSERVLSARIFNSRPQEFRRFKSKKSKPKPKADDPLSDDEDETDEITEPGVKVITCRVPSNRIDNFVKAGLGISKNKVEGLFYESKLRLNGQKVPKKSFKVADGDEIDVVKGKSESNPDLLSVSRIEIIRIRENDDEDGFIVKLKRFKQLTVENYEGANAWTVNSE